MENIAFDSHKRYTLCSVEDGKGRILSEDRIKHERGAIRRYLERFTPGSPVAVETIGNWYWIVDEIEQARMDPQLVHARKAKMMICCVNKTDKLDVRGLNRLQRVGTLPTVWIPSGELRDQRDLTRTRMFLVNERTRMKNRVQATLAKYALEVKEISDVFGVQGRELLAERVKELPPYTRFAAERQLEQIDGLDRDISLLEEKMKEVFTETEELRLLRTIPGIGFLLGAVVSVEVGDVNRFPGPDRLASYSGTTPRVHSSGGKTRFGNLRPDVNRYLKWAFMEAANSVCAHRFSHPDRHMSRLYEKIRNKKGHPKAIGAVARHLAEAVYWVLKNRENYKEPNPPRFSSKEA
jgi:transposase